MAPDHRQIEELFHAAREGSPEERAEPLAQADPELRREVESLLSQRSADRFLGGQIMQAAAQMVQEETVTVLTAGTSLGPYRIESKLGEGGMGEVYRARDTRVGRAVAIKASHQQFSARFDREARAISSLNHPHICTPYDVGPNYLVMELVQGETLTAHLKKGLLSTHNRRHKRFVFNERIGRFLCTLKISSKVHRFPFRSYPLLSQVAARFHATSRLIGTDPA